MLDNESLLLAKIINTMILSDFRFSKLHYFGKSNPLMHIKLFNESVGVQNLTSLLRCRAFPLTLEERARDWFRKLPREYKT